MLASKLLIAAALAALALPSQATPVFMDFEGVPNAINNLATGINPYSANVQFVGSALSATSSWPNSPNGGSGSGAFFRDPNIYGSGTQGALFMADLNGSGSNTSLLLNVAAGFGSTLSLLYAGGAGNGSGYIAVYEELDGQGKQLGSSFSLSNTGACHDPDGGAVVPDYVCAWNVADISFGGTAKSVRVFGSNGAFWLDDIRLGEASGTIPEPGGVALTLMSLGALLLTRRKLAP